MDRKKESEAERIPHRRVVGSAGHPPPARPTGDEDAADSDASRVRFFATRKLCAPASATGDRRPRVRSSAAVRQDAAARGSRLREFRWKNNAWLATAETMAGWNGFEMRNAGSGRSPVRKRSG